MELYALTELEYGRSWWWWLLLKLSSSLSSRTCNPIGTKRPVHRFHVLKEHKIRGSKKEMSIFELWKFRVGVDNL